MTVGIRAFHAQLGDLGGDITEDKVDRLIKDARKQNAETYRFQRGLSKEVGAQLKREAIPIIMPKKCTKSQYLVSLKKEQESLENDINKFALPLFIVY